MVSIFHVRGAFKVFLGRAPNRDIFYKHMFFRQSKFEANSEKNGSEGSGGMLSRKIFNILHGVWPFSALWTKFDQTFCPHLESFTKYDSFCSHIFDVLFVMYVP